MSSENEYQNMGRIFLVGCGAHARKLYYYVLSSGVNFGGFLTEVEGDVVPVGDQQLLMLDRFPPPSLSDTVIVAIGHPGIRRRLTARCEERGWRLGTLVHKTAYCAPDVYLGEGSVICAGAVVETGVQIGRGVIVDVGAVIDHDSVVSDFAHIRAGQICTSASKHTQ